MAQPGRRGGPPTAKEAPGQAGAGGGARAGPTRLGPTAGRPRPVSRQQPGKGKRGKRKGRAKKQKKPEVDILSPAAMLNLHYIAHNAAHCLFLRGFRWPGAPKSKKGKKA
ncbi:small lysine-rich protein 1 isoform X1 [Sorex araneus]|uniref:small lysine-rich protein 1 isoform X1 n=1 Tax=Sorex araneus TaxID=42254 RepID=UPI0024336051|nr:small lysine-rich protein 1 isoform X1 [Sorex araneus]